jgi:hypothetical protein
MRCHLGDRVKLQLLRLLCGRREWPLLEKQEIEMNDKHEITTTHVLSTDELDLVAGGRGDNVINAVVTAIIKAAIASGDLIPANNILGSFECK